MSPKVLGNVPCETVSSQAGGCALDWCENTPALTIWQLFGGIIIGTIGYPYAVAITQSTFSKILGPRPQVSRHIIQILTMPMTTDNVPGSDDGYPLSFWKLLQSLGTGFRQLHLHKLWHLPHDWLHGRITRAGFASDSQRLQETGPNGNR